MADAARSRGFGEAEERRAALAELLGGAEADEVPGGTRWASGDLAIPDLTEEDWEAFARAFEG